MNRQEWLKYRKTGIGSSDAYILTLDNPKWGTPLSLYKEKISTDDEPEEKSSFIMDKGQDIESKVRCLVEFVHSKEYSPALFKSKELPFIMASLDGFNKESQTILEIKMVGQEVFEKGECPKAYFTQIQHQYLASGAKNCFLAMYLESSYKFNKSVNLKNLKIIEVKPDLDFQKTLLEKEIDFWQNHVLKKKPPQETEHDFIKIRGFSKEVNRIISLSDKIKKMSEEKDLLKKELIKAAEEHNAVRSIFSKKLQLTKSIVKGSVNYSKIEALKGIDLDKFRKKSFSKWTLKM